jgi:hypothetical protein
MLVLTSVIITNARVIYGMPAPAKERMQFVAAVSIIELEEP